MFRRFTNGCDFVRGILFSSALLSGAIAYGQAPTAPSNLTAQASFPGDLAVVLFWDDNSLDEDGFEVQRCMGDGCGDFATIDISDFNNVNSFNDVGLAENTSYTYRVRAFNASGGSTFSNTATAKTSYARPLQVSNLQGSFSGGQVQLSWQDMADNETRFEVERAEIGVSTQYDVIATLPPDASNYIDTTMFRGALYSYRVRPWRFDVEGGAPATVDLEIGSPIASPTAVSARGKSRSSVEISWKGRFPRDAKVQVQRFDLDTATWATVGEVDANGKKFTDSGLQARTTYSFRLRTKTSTAVSLWEVTTATTR